ncbi:hypothetical protein ACA910_007921 [Epithemia clementina (nom. ined.)]
MMFQRLSTLLSPGKSSSSSPARYPHRELISCNNYLEFIAGNCSQKRFGTTEASALRRYAGTGGRQIHATSGSEGVPSFLEEEHPLQRRTSWTIPRPTWSVQKMMDTSTTTPPQSEGEFDQKQQLQSSLPPLKVLSRKSLIYLDDKRDSDRISELETDLEQTWTWIQQVRLETLIEGETEIGNEVGSSISSLGCDLADLKVEDVYDLPRGVRRGAPTRSHSMREEANAIKESKQVWRTFLEPRTKLVGGHMYFVIPTSKSHKSRSKS